MTLPTEPYPTVYPPVTGQDLPLDECDGADRPAEAEPSPTYAMLDMIALSGATKKQVDHWTRAGLLLPDARTKATNGVRRRWPQHELDVCTRMVTLVDVGLSVALAHQVARHGTFTDGRVLVRLIAGEQRPSAEHREILRAPGRAALLLALTHVRDTAAAAAELLGLDALDSHDRPLHEHYSVDQLIQMGEVITGGNDMPPLTTR